MPLIALAGVLVPDVFFAALLFNIIIPCKIFHFAHYLSVVLQIVICGVEENKIIASGDLTHFKSIGNFSAIICGNSCAVKISALTIYYLPACGVSRNYNVAYIAQTVDNTADSITVMVFPELSVVLCLVVPYPYILVGGDKLDKW